MATHRGHGVVLPQPDDAGHPTLHGDGPFRPVLRLRRPLARFSAEDYPGTPSSALAHGRPASGRLLTTCLVRLMRVHPKRGSRCAAEGEDYADYSVSGFSDKVANTGR